MNAVLAALILLPLLGSALTLAPGLFGREPGAAGRRALWFGAIVTGLDLVLAVVLGVGFDRGHSALSLIHI